MCNAHDAAEQWYRERRRKRKKKATKKTFAGFAKYSQYLSSALWKEIRLRVLDNCKWTCQLCNGAARQVHHRSYDKRTMNGSKLTHLLAVCSRCHKRIEFDDEGKKRSAKKAELWLQDALSRRTSIDKS